MASRSRVIPSLDMFSSIQYQYTQGRVESAGCKKPSARRSVTGPLQAYSMDNRAIAANRAKLSFIFSAI